MVTIVQVICRKGPSLRDAIANDPHLDDYDLIVLRQMQPGRSPGWTKINSTDHSRQGTINLEWSGATNILTCRVVNKGAGKPDLIIGDFVNFLMGRYRKRLKLINVLFG